MRLDIRLPLGLLFAFLGALLVVSGLVADKGVYARSLGININLWWGLVMLVFGAVMLLMGRRGTSGMRSAEASLEGQTIEEIEHRKGLESERARRDH